MGKDGDASVFRVWGSRVFVRDTSAEKVSSRAIPCGPAPSGVSQVDPLPLAVHVEVAVDSGAARGAASGGAASEGAASGGAEPASVELGGAEPEGAEPGSSEFEGADSGGANLGVLSLRVRILGVRSLRVRSLGKPLSLQQLREWFAQRTRVRSGAAGAGGSAAGGSRAGGAGATSLGGPGVTTGAEAAGAGGIGGAGAGDTGAGGIGAGDPGGGGTGAGDPRVGGTGAGDTGAGVSGGSGVTAGAGGTRGAGAAGPGGARSRGTGASGTGAGAGGAGAEDPGVGGAGTGGAGAGSPGARGTMKRLPFFLPPPPSSLQPPDSVLSQSRPASPLRGVRTGRRVPCPRPPPVPGTHIMALRPSSVPLPTVPRLLAIVDTDPSFESTAASTLGAELVDFAAAYRLNYATSLVAESESDCPLSVGGECALGTDVVEDKQEEFESLATAVSHLVAVTESNFHSRMLH
ncbi:unnamed protein product [Closterium sp. NIES-54]